ncbi:MAG: N-acetylglucosamine kinase [Ignavibacteriae bacterium]|nr:N-acetylglucosamine kinase [Ignavibacteriota bacterium]
MILIADSGSTKTDWVLIDKNKNQQKFHTIGYNPYFIDTENIYYSLSENLIPGFDANEVKQVWFYGAGCSTPEKNETVEKALRRTFLNANEIFVGHDLLASAIALLGDQPGFAAILGTGANTCLYDGKNVTLNIDSLGYLLGDEGSGCFIGRKLVRDYMRKLMPQDLWDDFKVTYQMDNEQIFDSLYHTMYPNRFLAGFARFADKHKHTEYIRSKVRDSFNDFFKNLVSRYPDYKQHKLSCVGSIGFIFKDILADTAEKWGMQTGKVIQSPIEGLVEYHLQKI